jgi:hypothetical protein
MLLQLLGNHQSVNAPELTQEQKDQNTANTHRWSYTWNEAGQSWDLVNTQA